MLKCQTETHEARAVSARIETLRLENGVSYGDIAIFYRTNAQSRALEQALRERTVPYQMVSRRPGDVPIYFADATQARNILGWHAKRDLPTMCKDAWSWQLANLRGY